PNRERQAVEERILREALAQVESWPEARRARRGYVLADEGWHEGVIGIVASRLVERYHRPVVLIAGTDDLWKGSGRSIPAFDLHAGLAACSTHLDRFGGHRAAAGLSIRPDAVEEFASAFAATAASAATTSRSGSRRTAGTARSRRSSSCSGSSRRRSATRCFCAASSRAGRSRRPTSPRCSKSSA